MPITIQVPEHGRRTIVSGDLQEIFARLRDVLEDMQKALDEIIDASPPAQRDLRARLERWIVTIGSILAQDTADLRGKPLLKAHMAAAILGRDVAAEAGVFSLHELTQIAALVRPGRTMTVKNADSLSAIERAGIQTACPGSVSFH
jgi:hypothetical protein